MINAKLLVKVHIGDKPVLALLGIDIGRQLEGVISADFVRWDGPGWLTQSSSVAVRTVDDQPIQDIQREFANTHHDFIPWLYAAR